MSRPRGRSTTCVTMEGYLTIPPDRGAILGRAMWKTRYVVIGSAQGEVNDGKGRSGLSSNAITYLSIYKNPDDWEPSQQYAVCNVTSCSVQMVAHRKQGPVLPTLILTIAPDPGTEKLRKRRSSRAATLVSNKDNGPTTLWFRTDGEASRLYEWARSIQLASQPSFPDHTLPMSPMSPISPVTPMTPSFQNPFVPFALRDVSESSFSSSPARPPSAPGAAPKALHHKASSSLHTHRERPMTISDAQSLRSRRSDLSSLTSSIANTATTQHSYASIMPNDLPTPIEADGDLFGWTSAQGRSSVLHSPARTVRDSLGSDPPLSPVAVLDTGSSPPGPRETILDRAFQLHYIPGSDQTVPGEEKLSSLARFEALMQQVDKRTASRQVSSRRPMSVKEQLELKSAWSLDESDEEDKEEEEEDDDDDDDDDSDAADSDDTEGDSPAADRDPEADSNSIRLRSRRTATLPGHHHHQKQQTPGHSPRGTAGPRSPIKALNPEALAALSADGGAPSPDRPRRAHKMHTAMGSLSLGVHQPPPPPRPRSRGNDLVAAAAGDKDGGDSGSRSSSVASASETASSLYADTSGRNPAAAYRTSTLLEGQQQQQQQQQSSAEADSQAPEPGPGPMLAAADCSEKCKSWRNSVGMFGNEGGFL